MIDKNASVRMNSDTEIIDLSSLLALVLGIKKPLYPSITTNTRHLFTCFKRINLTSDGIDYL